MQTSRKPSVPVTFPCADGTVLHGQLFQPDGPPAAAIVFHGGTAVRASFYASFAHWLCRWRNAAVLIYDYRGYGESAAGPVCCSSATMAEWGVQDQGAALDYLCGRFPGLPIEVMGHSLGGMFFAFHKNAPRVRRFTAIASGPAHWTRHPLSFTPAVLAFWFGIGPLLTWLFGYMPGRMIGLGADVPGGAYWQWRRWSVSRGFHRVDWGRDLPVPDLERVRSSVRLIAIAGDPMIPPSVVRDLAALYPHARTEYRLIAPSDAGTRDIGHVQVFTGRCSAAWPILAGEAAVC